MRRQLGTNTGVGGDDPSQLTDRTLIEALAGTNTGLALEAELRRRLADPALRGPVRALLHGYAAAAPEYVDERIQAAARHYLSLVDQGAL